MKFNANGRLQPRNQEVAKINKPLSKKFDLDTVLEVLEALVSKMKELVRDSTLICNGFHFLARSALT